MYCTQCHYGSDVCRMKQCPQCRGTEFEDKPVYAHTRKGANRPERKEKGLHHDQAK